MDTESEEGCTVPAGLKARGLSGVRLVVSDAHAGCGGHSAPAAGMRLAALHHPPAEEPPVRHGGKAAGLQGVRGELVHAACYESDPELSRAVWGGRALVGKASPRAAEIFSAAEDSALAFQAFPQPLAEAQDQQRSRKGRTGRSRGAAGSSSPSPRFGPTLRLSAASILSEEGRRATQRVFSEESAALGFRHPGPGRPHRGRGGRRWRRRAARIVAEITETYGLRKE